MVGDIKRSTRSLGCGLVFGLALSACTPQETGTEASDRGNAPGVTVAPVTVAEAWLTERDERDNVDSVAVWAGEGRQWLLATAKESHVLIVYDAATGEALDRIGGAGNAAGRFLRPNGISVVDDRVWVVERDNHRVQVLSLPDFEPLATFGAERLEKPYGLWVMPTPEGYRVFVTDAYEMPDESVPPDDQLDERLHVFEVRLDGGMRASYGGALGPTEGEGVLKKVESIYGDPAHDRLLVADELAAELDVKLFDLQGRFTGETLGEGILRYEPEGIALARCPDQRGYWIVTDQDEQANRFLVFDRVSLDYLGAFTGETTRNTDGVWLHQSRLPGFDAGAFYAVHNDGNVAAFDLGAIYAELGLEACPPAG
jgi:3-phytase